MEVILGAGVFEGVMPTLPEVVADLMFDSALVGVGLEELIEVGVTE